ncbi:CBS domain-containing protein [Streptomyces neyagawaensis]|uniref:CBS domain-containing protein n=1 Tax=Streptomyces neyagawaensis TaxID=42238 RepID=UPI0006E1E2DB|nr:CBS domain-containing protein [Streptomyces neyagawaensis]MCL6735991.1 CBS domain-containing protein [Streptomyces neyagawaensis]MDE1686909.1 CBS domain-containing protein [Streptomyces neyagawaensis]
MRHRMVSDLMTTDVVRVRRDTGFKEIAKLLAEYDITAVPVVDDDDRPLGVVSEADLLRKEAAQLDPAGLLPVLRPMDAAGAKAEASTAEGLMNSPAVTARPQWTVVEAAQVMERHHVKRLPVVDEAGRLVGLISRADLLRVFLRGDSAIREEIAGEVLVRTLGLAPDTITVRVVGGRVTLRGTVERASMVPVVLRLCRGVDGVVDVSAELDHRTDDTAEAPSDQGMSRRSQLAN